MYHNRGNYRSIILACVTSLVLLFFLDAVPGAMMALKSSHAQAVVGGDVVVKSPRVMAKPAELAAEVSESIKMSSMMHVKNQNILVHLQVIDENYPLYGNLVNTGEALTTGVWVDQKLAKRFQLQLNDEVRIGNHVWVIQGMVTQQDEKHFDFSALSPSVYIAKSMMPKLGLVTDTARLHHYLYFKTRSPDQLAEALKPYLAKDSQVILPAESFGQIERVLTRLFDVFYLLRLMSYVLTGFLIHLVLNHYARICAKGMAVYMAFGERLSTRWMLYLIPLARCALIAIGVVLGMGTGLFAIVNSQWQGLVALMLFKAIVHFLMIFGVLTLWHGHCLLITPVLVLLKSKIRSTHLGLGLMVAVMFGVQVFLSDTRILSLSHMVVFLSLLLMIYGAVLLLQSTLVLMLKRGNERVLLLLNHLRLYRFETVSVSMFLGLILGLSVLLWHLETQLIPSWQNQFPAKAPNAFFIGIQPREVPVLKARYAWFKDATFYPVIKARLLKINGEGIKDYRQGMYADHEALNRQLNLTQSSALPEENQLIAGEWGGGVSIEKGIMERLGLGLGDRLTFLLYGEEIDVEIMSVRGVNWQSMGANFYFIFNENMLNEYPVSYMTSTYVSSDDSLTSFYAQHPGITHLDVDAFVSQAREVFSKVLHVMRFFLGLLGGFLFTVFWLLLDNQSEQKIKQLSKMHRLGYRVKAYPIIFDAMKVIFGLSGTLVLGLNFAVFQVLSEYLGLSIHFDPQSLWGVVVLLIVVKVYSQWMENRYVCLAETKSL